MTQKINTIAFIGLGAMGQPMALHLKQAGFTLRCFARSPAAQTAALQLGASMHSTPAQAAQGADCVITNVTATEDVQAVLLGEHGAAHSLQAGSLCIDHSTIAARGAVDIARQLSHQGIDFLDAPVSGGTAGAIAATLAIMVGGELTAFQRAQAVLECYGKTIVYAGHSGSGQVIKACNQMVQVINIQGIAEAMHLAKANGVDPQTVLKCLSAGMAGSKMLDLMGAKMASQNFTAGIQARLHHKDFGLVADMAEQLGLHLPTVHATLTQLNTLMGLNMGHDDTSSLLRVLEQQAAERAE